MSSNRVNSLRIIARHRHRINCYPRLKALSTLVSPERPFSVEYSRRYHSLNGVTAASVSSFESVPSVTSQSSVDPLDSTLAHPSIIVTCLTCGWWVVPTVGSGPSKSNSSKVGISSCDTPLHCVKILKFRRKEGLYTTSRDSGEV